MPRKFKALPFTQVPNTMREAFKEVGKTKGNSNYRNGRALEYKVIKDLRNKGLEGLRTAGSHGVADIVAYHPRSLTDGLVDILRPQEMVQVVLDGWQRLPDDKILGDFLYGGLQVAPSGKHDYTIHVSPVLCTLIQVKRRKR